MTSRGLTNWVLAGSPEFRAYLKLAKKAGKRGEPDPSRSSMAPACFSAWRQLSLDQLHHLAGFMLDDIQVDRQILAGHGHPLQLLAFGVDLSEAEERRLLRARQARERIQARVQRFYTESASIEANWKRGSDEMREAYTKHYPYADHIDSLTFPALDLGSIRYGDGGGFGLGDLLPAQPSSPQGLGSFKGALER